MTLSPTDTSSGTRWPLSSIRPGPTDRTSPSWGFSFAVSGMTSPDAVVCSASRALTTIRSSSGLMETDTCRLFLLTSACTGLRWELHVWVGTLTRRVPAMNLCRQLALGQPECQPGAAAPGPGRWSGRCEDRRMDLAGLATLLTPEGWALLEALPPYDEQTAIRLGEHLRRQ